MGSAHNERQFQLIPGQACRGQGEAQGVFQPRFYSAWGFLEQAEISNLFCASGLKMGASGNSGAFQGKEGAEAVATLCLCDLERGKYTFADIVEISVEGVGQVSLSPSHCVDLSLGFSLVCSEHSLSSHRWLHVEKVYLTVEALGSTLGDLVSPNAAAG